MTPEQLKEIRGVLDGSLKHISHGDTDWVVNATWELLDYVDELRIKVAANIGLLAASQQHAKELKARIEELNGRDAENDAAWSAIINILGAENVEHGVPLATFVQRLGDRIQELEEESE